MSNPFLPADQQPQQQPPAQQYAPAPQQPQQAPNPFQPGAAPAQQYAPQQPVQQYAAPQQYAPAAPASPYQQQAAPQYAAPQQYTQQPQQYPQQAAPAAAVPVARPGQFLTPPPPSEGGSGNMPRIADLQGRLLIVMPEKVDRQVPGKYDPADRMTCTVVVLDGGPLQWGGTSPTSPRRNENVPYVVKGLWIRQTKLVEQLEEALALRLSGGPGLALGRLWKTGNGQNDPYVLATPTPQDSALYDQYVSQVNPFAL